MSGEDVETLLLLLYLVIMLGVPFLFVLYRKEQRVKSKRILDLLNRRTR